MTCEWKPCQKPYTHFVVIGRDGDKFLVRYVCMYHYCLFYGIGVKEEAKICREFMDSRKQSVKAKIVK